MRFAYATIFLLAALLIGGVPMAAQPADSPKAAPTTLYFHLDGSMDFLINTQGPDDHYSQFEGIGIATHDAGCVPDPAGTGLLNHKYHTYYGFSGPTLVVYNNTEGKPRLHSERGLADDVDLDPDTPVVLHWYLATQTSIPSQPSTDPNTAPVVVPQVVVRATMRTGERLTADDNGYNSGSIILAGESKEALLGGTAATTQNAEFSQVNGRPVYGFSIPLKFEGGTTIPKPEGFSLRLDVFERLASDVCDDPANGYLMPNTVAPHTSAGHRPRIELGVLNPLRTEAGNNFMPVTKCGDNGCIEEKRTGPRDPDLLFYFALNSPWGNYDVDGASANFTVQGPDGAHAASLVSHTQRYHEHGYPTQAVDYTWRLNTTSPPLPAGPYTATLRYSNLQHTANETVVIPFDYQAEKASPGVGPMFVTGLLTLAAFVRRRPC